MLGVDRRLKILERVAEDQSIQVGELATAFAVSEMTIRRDIQRLERDGFLRRTYGGASAHLTRSLDLAFNARALQKTREKRLIGMTAARLVGDARSLFVGIGTTAEQFARFVPAAPEVTVVTGSLPVASLLGTRPLRVVVLGGNVRRDELSCVGPAAAATLERYRFDLAVLGAAGVSAVAGITDLNDDEAAVHRLAADRSARVVVIADGSKVGVVTMAAVVPVGRVSVLVTDPTAPEAELRALRAAGVEVVLAQGTATAVPSGSEPLPMLAGE